MKFFLSILLFVFLIGCDPKEENPVAGKLYVFSSVPDLPTAYDEKVIFEYMAFLDEEAFILSYSENFQHQFVRGNYQVEDSSVYLQFEKTAYNASYPEKPVNNGRYEPVISESKWKYPELKMKLSAIEESIRLDKTGMEQSGKINPDLELEDFINGIKSQQLEFMLERETIKIK